MKVLLGIGLSLLLIGSALATKPCSPDSWFSNPKRPSAEWAEMAKWVAVAKVKKRKEIIEPYHNCYMQDRSKCTMEDRSIITVKVLRFEKGQERIKVLQKGYCAPSPPKKVGETLRFYGNDPESYLYYEPLEEKD